MSGINYTEDLFNSFSWMKEILLTSNIGLWVLEIDKHSDKSFLYADTRMLELLGLKASLSPEDNYAHFARRIIEEDSGIVQRYIRQIIVSQRLGEVQHR